MLMAILIVAPACGGGDGGDGGDSTVGPLETPTFSEGSEGVDTAAGGAAATSPPTEAPEDPVATTAGDAPSGTPAPPTGARGAASVSFDDPVGDATRGVGTDEPPPWTDLAGGSLERDGNAYRLRVRLGGDAPQTAPGRETMNIASFYDVDGDGAVDYEIWVNLGRSGWGPVWYDDEGNAAPGDDSNVTVVVDGDEVRLLFPDVMLGTPDRLRFSIASEYGELSTIGSASARRDDAPDNDAAVSFP